MMDCSEIRTLLSEYLDDALDENAKARVDEHLRTCGACQKELDSLKALVKEIGSLESVKAPADFLDQLHKRMERRSRISEVWEWLFYPLRVKIPLQLAGAAVMAFLIFSILPMQQLSLKLSTKPEQENKDAAYYTDEAKGTIQPAERAEAPVQKATPGGPSEDKETAKPPATSKPLIKKVSPGGLASDKDIGKQAESSEALVQKAAIPEPAKGAREVALHLKRQVRAKAVAAEHPTAPAPASSALQEMQKHKLSEGVSAQEDKKEVVPKKETEPALSVTKAVEAAGGKVLSMDSNPQTGLPESVHAEIPAGAIPLLYEKLRELGDLQVSPETGAEKDFDLVPIKIRLIGLQ